MKNFILSFVALLMFGAGALSEVPVPPSPREYFNDYAGLVSAGKASELNNRLIAFDNQTTTQIVVAVFPVLAQDADLEEYSNRIFAEWKIGTAENNNGAALFVFHKAESDGKTKIRIEVGYGLEGVIPDAVANRIIQNEIIPHFKAAKAGAGTAEWDAGFDAAVTSLLVASQGEYTAAEEESAPMSGLLIIVIVIVAIILIAILIAACEEGGFGGGYSGGYSGGSSWGGSSSSSSSSGSFGGGGGSSGGGGASGSC